MITMTRTVSILVPGNLLTKLEAFLADAPDMREALKDGKLVLSADPRAKGDIVLAPTLETIAQWALNREGWWHLAVTEGSRLMARLSELAANGNAVVIR